MKHTLTIQRKVDVIKIALTGKLRAGKDEVANRLCIQHRFDRVAFGDALKRNAHAVFPWVSERNKPRALYQQFGQLIRQIDPETWVKHAERSVESLVNLRAEMGDERIGIVVTDLRQPNEYEWARANGFTIVRVTAPDDVRLARAQAAGDDFTEADLTHETEQAIDGFAVDYEIRNDSGLVELYAQVDAIVDDLVD
jgi:dephospho-CoA kinase